MNYHTLSKEECKEIILVEFFKIKKYEDDKEHLIELIENIKYWESSLSSINNILTIVLEQFEKKGFDSNQIIKYVYELSNSCNFIIQETDLQFIDQLYTNTLNNGLLLDEYLINTQNELLSRL